MLRGQDVALGSLCFATDPTGGVVTAFTAEDADGEVGVSLPSLLHQERTVGHGFCLVQRLQLCSLSHLLLEIGTAAQAGKEKKQETGSLGPSAQCHHAFCPAVQSKDLCSRSHLGV